MKRALAWIRISSLALIAALSTPSVSAQITEATLQGKVTDIAGQVLVSAGVTARNQATGQTRNVNTNEHGNFTLASLSPGSYTVGVQVTGFRAYQQRDVTLNVGRTTELSIKLEVGQLQETVEVVAAAEAVAVSREGRLADTFTQRSVTELPLPQ